MGQTAGIPPRSVQGRWSEFSDHWPTLVGATLASSIGTIGLQAYTGGSFMPALIADTGYTREQVALATLFLSATVALTAPFVGQLIDRVGARRVIAFAVFGEAIGFAVLSVTPAYFPAFAAAMAFLGVLGVGTTPPSFSRLISARFDRSRGLALGIMISGLGVTAITAPVWATAFIAVGGWRGAYRLLSGLVLLLGVSGLLIMRRDRSEPPVIAAPAGEATGWSALRRPLFWVILVCFASPALFGGGDLLHLISILREKGFSPRDAAMVQGMIGASIISGRLLSGAAMDRFFAPYVAAAAFALAASGCAMLLSDNTAVLYVAALAVGLPIGAELDILAYTLSRYFGLASFGRCYSLAYSFMIVSGGVSPVMIAYLAPAGDYTRVLVISAAGLLACAVAVALLPRFQPKLALERNL